MVLHPADSAFSPLTRGLRFAIFHVSRPGYAGLGHEELTTFCRDRLAAYQVGVTLATYINCMLFLELQCLHTMGYGPVLTVLINPLINVVRFLQHFLVSQAPRRWRFVERLPRNAMGKLNKKELLKDFMETAV